MSNDLSKRNRGKSLIVVEGDGEVEVLDRIFKSFPELNITKDNVIVFHSNIYKLYNKIQREYGTNFYDEDIDIPYVVSKDKKEGKTYRKRDFINIFIVFDFDPQAPEYDLEKLNNLFCCLNDSTDNGKLYMNFPMLESYKHVQSFDQEEYNKLTIKYEEIKKGKQYKDLVEKTSIINYYFNIEKSIINCLKSKEDIFIHGDMDSLIKDIKKVNNDTELKNIINYYLEDKESLTLYNYLTNGHKFQSRFLKEKNYNFSLRELFIRLINLNINQPINNRVVDNI